MQERRETFDGIELINLMEASESLLGEFTEMVEESRNRLQVLVHPYYNDNLGLLKGEDYAKYLIRQQRFIEACMVNNIPLVILDEAGQHQDLLIVLPEANGRVYIVETNAQQAKPVDNRGFKYVFEVFRQSGVEHVAIGGNYMTISSSGAIAGCAGVFFNEALDAGFNAKISTISYPAYMRGDEIVIAKGFNEDSSEFTLEIGGRPLFTAST